MNLKIAKNCCVWKAVDQRTHPGYKAISYFCSRIMQREKISHYFRITWELSISYSRGFSLFILYHFLYIRTCYIFVLWIYINIYISFCITFFIRLLLKGACKLKYSSYSVFLIKLGLYKKSFLMLQLKIALSLLFSTSFHQKYKEYELQ